MPIKSPEEIRNADTVQVDPEKLATKHADEKFAFPKGEDKEAKDATDQGNGNTQENPR